MKTDLVRIGNSRGVRIPKPIIEQCGFRDTVELSIENNRLVISPHRRPREGWEEAFRKIAGVQKDELLLPGPNDFDNEEWEW
jgi:antitoxin MazE